MGRDCILAWKQVDLYGRCIVRCDVDCAFVESQKLRRSVLGQFFGQGEIESVGGMQAAISFSYLFIAKDETDVALWRRVNPLHIVVECCDGFFVLCFG